MPHNGMSRQWHFTSTGPMRVSASQLRERGGCSGDMCGFIKSLWPWGGQVGGWVGGPSLYLIELQVPQARGVC